MICGIIHKSFIYFFIFIKSRRAGVSFNDDERSGGQSGEQNGWKSDEQNGGHCGGQNG
jgi:hypothetical protein